jgi:hypothetical protein
MSAPVIRVHIERLVLDGIDGYASPISRHRLEGAVRAALLQQMTERPPDATSSQHEPFASGVVRINKHTTPERLGRQVAAVVHRSVTS